MSESETDEEIEELIEEATYEVIGRRHGRIQIEIDVPGERKPIGHGVKLSKAKKHPDGVQGFIEEQVMRIAARHVDPADVEDEEIPERGKVSFDPRTRDGRRLEERFTPEERRARRGDGSEGDQNESDSE